MDLQLILTTVCTALGMSESEVLEKNRKHHKVWARQLCMYFAHEYKLDSLANIGRFYGIKDHCTVIHAIKVVNNEIDTNKANRAMVEKIRSTLDDYCSKDTFMITDETNYDYQYIL